MSLPSKTNTTAIVLTVSKDSAGADSVVHEDSAKFLDNH